LICCRQGDVDTSPDVGGIVDLNNIFAAVVKPAIAEEEAEAAVGEVGLMILSDGVGTKAISGAVLFAMPPCAVCA